MRNAKARIIATAANVVACLSLYSVGRCSDSTLIEDSFREQPISWQLKRHEESTGELDGRYIVFLKQYSPEILAAAEKYDVSPVLIDAVFVEESYNRSLVDDWKDSIALAWNKSIGDVSGYTIDASLGPGQVNMSTARFLDEKYKHPSKTREELEDALVDPAQNID